MNGFHIRPATKTHCVFTPPGLYAKNGANPNPKTRETQPGDPYRLPIEVAIKSPRARIEKIEMTGKQQKFEIAVEQEPFVSGTRSQYLDADGG